MKGIAYMAKSILQKLYDGEIYPSENIVVATPEYHRTKKASADEKERLMKTLSGESREICDKIEELYDKLSQIYGYADFAHGFKLAVALIFESQNNTGTGNFIRTNGE